MSLTGDCGDALALLGATLRGFGHWGGHTHRAGGKITGIRRDDWTPETLYAALKVHRKTRCSVGPRGRRGISRCFRRSTSATGGRRYFCGGLLRDRWLAACTVDPQRGSRLVRKHAILEHL
jgi:hypothetical protein